MAGRQGKGMVALIFVLLIAAAVVIFLLVSPNETEHAPLADSPPATVVDPAPSDMPAPVAEAQDQAPAPPAVRETSAAAQRVPHRSRNDILLIDEEEQEAPSEEAASETGHTSVDYQRLEFEHVPSWIPLPPSAVAASAEDAWLRSDGFVEGTLHFDFQDGADEVVGSLVAAFESEGMAQVDGGMAFAMSQPPRNVEIMVGETDSGLSRVTVQYSGIDHEKGCACVTCGGPGSPDGDVGHEP